MPSGRLRWLDERKEYRPPALLGRLREAHNAVNLSNTTESKSPHQKIIDDKVNFLANKDRS